MDEKTPKILVPIGFSEQSILALQNALHYAKALKAEIVLLSVIEEAGILGRLFSSSEEGELENMKKKIEDKLKEIATEYSRKGNVSITTMMANGVVYEEIARVAELLDVEMVIMGTNGRPGNFQKRMIGSNAYRVVASVKAPVVTVKGVINPDKLDTIIFPIVLDRKSKEKVAPAIHYARLFNAKIKVVAVANSETERKKLRPHVEQVSKFFRSKDVNADHEIIPSEGKKLHEAILDYGVQNQGDLVMIMEDTDESTIRLFGSDAEKFVYFADFPVMCITPSFSRYENMFANW
ncbi:MAG: universal stress protein [Bacteroidota bacterium]|nr:universal stress protein [Bacteroidota bacterium]MDX5427036.1 universal stress protein [Bacteroidota bacterium]MDX5447496.1 universal stress protein [Bacteroidota bacterium]MDX5505013.1 universal stress protein [Bacteroidota bacterium]